MNVSEETRKMSAALKDVGITDADFCARVGIDKGTFFRWKTGVGPKLETWIRAVNMFDSIMAEKEKA